MNRDSRNFWCFMGTLVAIVALSKIGGGSGTDLAIMTGLVSVLGMLARPSQPDQPTDVTVTNPPDDPVPVATTDDQRT